MGIQWCSIKKTTECAEMKIREHNYRCLRAEKVRPMFELE